MLRALARRRTASSLLCQTPVGKYHWVYKNGESGYEDKRIEQKLLSLSKGGHVHLDVIDEVSIVKIDNPAKRNALTGSMIISLRDVVKKLWDCEESKAVVVCGEGTSFCSGMDLNLAAGLTSLKDGMDMCMYMQNTLTAFQLLPKLTVAAIRGPALGGGAELITAADFRLMCPDSKIQFVQKNMGITPGWGGATRLRQIVGQRKAMYLLASSEVVDAKSALLIGLADVLMSDSGGSPVERAAVDWLDQRIGLSGTDKLVFTAIKESTLGSSYDEAGCLPIDYMMKREKDILANVWGKPPNLEALQRVRAKR